MSKKKYKKSTTKTVVNEQTVPYEFSLGEDNRVTITTLEELEERDREHTRRMTHEQRMEYLQKLIYNLWGPDLTEQKGVFTKGRINIIKPE